VWSKTLNLRQEPSDSAMVIRKLSYGTPVTITKQNINTVPYQLNFFSYTPEELESIKNRGGASTPVILNSEWIKVKTNQNEEGYLINKLLLSIKPIKENDYKNYFLKIFDLTQYQKKVIPHKDFSCEYSNIDEIFTSRKNKVIFKLSQTVMKKDNIDCHGLHYEGGEILLPQFSFEEAFVFLDMLMNFNGLDFNYKANSSFGYAYDEAVSGEADLKKTKKGILFTWGQGDN
jgi:hypothetical protein